MGTIGRLDNFSYDTKTTQKFSVCVCILSTRYGKYTEHEVHNLDVVLVLCLSFGYTTRHHVHEINIILHLNINI